jgi:protein-disulfide isomerase
MSKKSTRDRLQTYRIQQERKNRIFLIAGVAIGALVIAGALIAFSLPQSVNSNSLSDYSDIAQSIDEIGAAGFALGDPAAPVTLTEYSDFSCPHCFEAMPSVHRLIDAYVRKGKLRIIYKTIIFVNPTYSTPAARAAICSGQQGKFWEMHDYIWNIYQANSPGAYRQSLFAGGAKAIGLNVDEWNQCFNAVETTNIIEAVKSEAAQRDVNGTPTFFVNGTLVPLSSSELLYDTLSTAIENALK